MIPKLISIFLFPSNLTSNVPKNLAKASAVAYFANSLGCSLNEPILNQACAPLLNEPVANNTNNKPITTM